VGVSVVLGVHMGMGVFLDVRMGVGEVLGCVWE